ncbi:MAG: glycosyltransferase [Actinomycetota bacterium]|nr:glycosyltransferase [Actinomycetota bacterium]
MKLLYLTPRFPHPAAKGDQLAAFHRLAQLGRRHEISLVSFYEDEAELAHADELRGVCESIETVRLPQWRGVANVAVRAPFSSEPLQILYYRSAAFARVVDELAGRRKFDIVHGFMLRMAPYLQQVEAPRVLDALDSMELRMRRNVEVEKPPRRWLFREELRRVASFERAVARSVDAVLVASQHDKESFATEKAEVVPNGVDADAFAPDPAARRPGAIVFSGTMSYSPNVRAARWFADECFPLVREAVPDATFVIAGAAPTRELRELAGRPGIVVTGFVQSMPETLNRATVAVAPMQSGAGIQNKILEAMACGLPLVATTIGLGGIAAVSGRDLLVADSPREFADAVVSVLREPKRADVLGENARSRVLEDYTWERAAAAVERVYDRLGGGLYPI